MDAAAAAAAATTTLACVCLALFFLFLSEAEAATVSIINNCPFTIWPATLTGGGKPQLSSTGFELPSQRGANLNVPQQWSGRFWARTDCRNDASGTFRCATGDCASGSVECRGAGGIPPLSLAEFFIAANGGQDFYDVSLVDGNNLPVRIVPQGGSSGCQTTQCGVDLNPGCPSELAVRNSAGYPIACKSGCLAYNTPQLCCTGQFGSPNSCRPSQYSQYFKSKCPQAYSYAYDDKSSTFTCSGGANYVVTFCP